VIGLVVGRLVDVVAVVGAIGNNERVRMEYAIDILELILLTYLIYANRYYRILCS
jgi:hypothetical protein